MKIPIKIINAIRHPKSNLKPTETDWNDVALGAENVVDLSEMLKKRLDVGNHKG